MAFGALICISVWALMPAFGAMSLYTLPPDVAHKLKVALSCEFGKAQVAMLQDGPGYLTLDSLHGSLIGFPSYHGVLALIAGTASVTVTAMALAVPFGVGAAIFVSEFCGPRIKETLKIVIELLAAIPSVVWGFIGLTVMNLLPARLGRRSSSA